MEIVWFILIGLAAGFLAGLIFKGRSLGLLWNLVVGVVGALIGAYILRLFNIQLGGLIGQFISSFIGACIVIWVFFSFKGK